MLVSANRGQWFAGGGEYVRGVAGVWVWSGSKAVHRYIEPRMPGEGDGSCRDTIRWPTRTVINKMGRT